LAHSHFLLAFQTKAAADRKAADSELKALKSANATMEKSAEAFRERLRK
jgi:hypothetical protein